MDCIGQPSSSCKDIETTGNASVHGILDIGTFWL